MKPFALRMSPRALLLALACAALAGCISLGRELPESLLTLSPTSSAPAGTRAQTGSGGDGGAIAVMTPDVPAKLDVLRVPVNVTDTEIAYLPEAFWVEKPARLFRRLLGETLRQRGGVFVIDNDDSPAPIGQQVRGTLVEMTYDARTSSAVVIFDAIRSEESGAVIARRFEARESVGIAEGPVVGEALNRAANTVASEVADWVLAVPSSGD
ncbi:MAG: ABC-type transport auxiliary lipoprotein family protein [Erythrobacter sp.]